MPLVQTKGAGSAQGVGQFARQAPAANYIEDVFSTYLYTGNGSTQTITNGIDLSTKGGLVWMKGRSNATEHALYDTLRGATKELNIWPYQEFTQSGLTAFNTNGFNLGSHTYVNANSSTYSSWTFRKQEKFFDVVTYTGNGTAGRTVAHNLGSVPGCIFIKCRDVTNNQWVVYHRSLGATQAVYLSAINVAATSAQFFNNTSPTATTFTLGSGGDNMVNASGATYVAYIFAHDAGGFGTSGTSNVISCGSYVGNGSSTGPNVTLGYEPQWILIKDPSAYEDWTMVDTFRGLPVNDTARLLFANVANSESPTNPFINVSATGFQPVVSSSRVNTNGNTYIYMAIRRGPMRTPTSGTSVFASTLDSAFTSAIPYVDMWINRDRVGAYSTNFFWTNRLVGMNQNTSSQSALYLNSNSTAAETRFATQRPYYDYVTQDKSHYAAGSSPVSWLFRRAPGFFDVVCYTGNSVNGRQVPHGLMVKPELMIVKNRNLGFAGSSTGWFVYCPSANPANPSGYLDLTSNVVFNIFSMWSTAGVTVDQQTSTNITLTDYVGINNSGALYVAYLFATLPGVSKVGSYTGTGAAQTINCGFTGGARFVLIKSASVYTGDWYIWDSARGIVAGNDPYLLLNSTAAEVTGTDYISVQSSGFGLTATAPAALNANGGTYIYLAIA